MITRIEAYRYRCFQALDLTLDAFQVFVGPNGAGKTTLLDIPVLLGEMLSSRSISKCFLEPTGSHPRPRADLPGDLIFNGAGDFFVLAVEAKLPDEQTDRLLGKQAAHLNPKRTELLRRSPQHRLTHIRYEIEFEVFNGQLQIAQEYLLLLSEAATAGAARGPTGLMGEWLREQDRSRLVPVIERPREGGVFFAPEAEKRSPRNEYTLPADEPAFANIFSDASRYDASLWLRRFLVTDTHPYQPSVVALRTAQPRPREPRLSRDASTLAWLANNLLHTSAAPVSALIEQGETAGLPREPSAFERWEQFVRLALPAVESIEPYVRPDDQHAYLVLHYRGGARVPAAGLSDGTLLILALTILPFLPKPPALLTHEEPENGVHPKGIELIVEALQSVTDSQVFVSTHSPLVLTQCEPGQIISLRFTAEGGVRAVRGDEDPVFENWHAEVDLGTLLAAGVL